MVDTVLIATHNSGKRREFRELLGSLEAELIFPVDLGLHLEVPEDGNSYTENAHQKAAAYANASGLLTLADDSGLEVDALNGAPGIHSARYARGKDTDRVTALLEELQGVSLDDRTARFRCVVILAAPDGKSYSAEGVCEGLITFAPQGKGGFGYDPVFYLPDHGCTMAQLSRTEKNLISHRARAVQAMLPTLSRLVKGVDLTGLQKHSSDRNLLGQEAN